MSDSEIAKDLASMISEILDQDVSPTAIEARLVDDYGANSMDSVDIVIRIERKFKIRIANEQIPQMLTFGDILRSVSDQAS